MRNKYVIGIDEGSQSAKIVIFDLEGNVVSEGTEALRPVSMPEPGHVEHPDDDLWDAIVEASQKALTNFPGNKSDIIGIGLCTIRFCRCVLKEDGTLVSPAMSWMDKRVSKPYEPTHPEAAYVTTSSGYITHRLTGEFRDTAANYQGMWPIDTEMWDWSEDEEVFDNYNIPRERLFTLQNPGTVLGHVTGTAAEQTGLPAGLPVVATANDKAVEALGAGILSGDTALISLGTYIAGMVHGRENPQESTYFWSNFAAIPGEYLHESNGIRRGMWTVSWFKEMFGDELNKQAQARALSSEDLLNEEAADTVPAGSDGLMTVLDWLPPADAPYKKGMMIGFDGRHTRAHIYHSILEAIALTMKSNVEAMCEEKDMELKNLVISGGGSNGDLMMQLFADAFGLPAKRNTVNGAASLGAAINTVVALGEYDSYEEATRHMVKVRDTFTPDPDKQAFYNRFNDEVYQQITTYTDGLLQKASAFFND
ncbi:FGGY-family carbohydrate kinase [Thalassobacillus sp. CUG 92003]|uniref:FGGY-family carbohydrate kinase n=1 Tax=Thalassobacillus sp. CUG 92003 TaxID=2736641 RepID=UPI0015E6BFD7|nr:FGGY family carbohydrate kinase [Thalassobacillus sp. CUG 92003]